MGRFYTGDIEGKFLFGVQSSNDAEFFGVVPKNLYFKKCGCCIDNPNCDCGDRVDHLCDEECDDNCSITSEENIVIEDCQYDIAFDFYQEHLIYVQEGLKICYKHLGNDRIHIDEFYADRNGYSYEKLAERLNISKEKVFDILEWYARIILGEKIEKCIQEKGKCNFLCNI
jgi:hypothetical protein